MTAVLKLTQRMWVRTIADLRRPHDLAKERVGFFSCRQASLAGGGLLLLAEDYHPVADAHYLPPLMGAVTIGPEAIRDALQIALTKTASIVHVHLHDHSGATRFSKIDNSENAKLIPDFFNVAPDVPHGAVALSQTHAFGQLWDRQYAPPRTFDQIVAIGAPIRFLWSGSWKTDSLAKAS